MFFSCHMGGLESSSEVVSATPHEKKALRVFLNKLLDTPEEWEGHMRHMTGSIILSVAYGIQVQSKDDPNIKAAEAMVSVLATAGLPGAFLVVIKPKFPLYVPSWFPGASFKRKAKAWNGIQAATITPPFMEVKKAMNSSSVVEDSFCARCLRNVEHPDPRVDHLSLEEEIIKETAGTMYEAQEELDRVIGTERLPDHDDQMSLPYVIAVLYESLSADDMRCLTLQYRTTLAFPHVVDVEDNYRGYRIPKDSIIFPNVWAIFQDEKIYGPNTHIFDPTRWLIDIPGEGWRLNSEMLDPTSISFGFGGRVCPGKHMALSTLWINIACILHSFNISNAIDDNGNLITPRAEYLSGVNNVPAPFKCSFKPRSQMHSTLVRAAGNEEEG
ncbi:cytochrome P450 [Rhodocollybia butyracea]|uniref:Cytochrome P450 n=1 Tax=Rhodocollybia butyracea TaxID=206335 RepID=A0A9P5PT29_9AGAR|nr:cytochrome P450 [Rhodocollybia butyracea]